MSLSPSSYRDRIYIIQDIILKLTEYGELNQTALISFSGLNLKKHRCILDELEVNGLIHKSDKKNNWQSGRRKNRSTTTAKIAARSVRTNYCILRKIFQ